MTMYSQYGDCPHDVQGDFKVAEKIGKKDTPDAQDVSTRV
jgi:hypothetical protein